jgi:hypothetical protein
MLLEERVVIRVILASDSSAKHILSAVLICRLSCALCCYCNKMRYVIVTELQ